MDSMILVSMFYVQRIENGSLGRKRRYFACFVCQDCHKNTGIKCVNNPYSAFLTDKTVPLNASTSLTVPVYVTVTLSPSFTSESPSGF